MTTPNPSEADFLESVEFIRNLQGEYAELLDACFEIWEVQDAAEAEQEGALEK